MLYKWPSHCCHASHNASSCIPTVSSTGADARWVIWPTDAWSMAVCEYIVPEKYYEAMQLWQLCNNKIETVPEQSWSEARTSPAPDGINSCSSYWSSWRMCSCSYEEKKSICGDICRLHWGSGEARTYFKDLNPVVRYTATDWSHPAGAGSTR